MFRYFLFALCLACATFAFSQTPSRKDVDITAHDGTKLRATFFSAGKPGPGVILLHMCNTTRKSWEPVALGLSKQGINALTIDNRGFGESGGPRFDLNTPEVFKELNEHWPGDFDAAFDFLISQAGIDKARIAGGGGSCGVDNVVKLAERHPDIKTLVLLAGTTDVPGYNFISHRPEMPIFTAAAADDEYNPATLAIMHWTSDISGNPRTKFSGFKDGKHGTEIFGPHPELVDQIVAFYIDTLITRPVNLKASTLSKRTTASEFWSIANEHDGAEKAAAVFHDARKSDPNAYVFPEFTVNLLGYAKLQSGEKQEAVELFKLNVEAYPVSANAHDSLSDGYIAIGRNDLALTAEEKCLELLPNDASNADFKELLGKQAREKVAKLKGEQK